MQISESTAELLHKIETNMQNNSSRIMEESRVNWINAACSHIESIGYLDFATLLIHVTVAFIANITKNKCSEPYLCIFSMKLRRLANIACREHTMISIVCRTHHFNATAQVIMIPSSFNLDYCWVCFYKVFFKNYCYFKFVDL